MSKDVSSAQERSLGRVDSVHLGSTSQRAEKQLADEMVWGVRTGVRETIYPQSATMTSLCAHSSPLPSYSSTTQAALHSYKCPCGLRSPSDRPIQPLVYVHRPPSRTFALRAKDSSSPFGDSNINRIHGLPSRTSQSSEGGNGWNINNHNEKATWQVC